MSGIQLVVQGDDLGMCHAVNEAIEEAFCDGIVTQATAMAPCSWIDEGARIAARNQIPTGMHCTLTAEWDHLRWRPLTNGASLVGPDGSFHRTVEEASSRIDPAEGGVELDAQLARLRQLGIEPAFFDPHMGAACMEALVEAVERHGKAFIYPIPVSRYPFTSIQFLSHHPADRKLDWMLAHLDGLTPGSHFLCTHPGKAGPELASLTRPDADNYPWAEAFRISDLAVLTDPRVRERVEDRGIELVSVTALQPEAP